MTAYLAAFALAGGAGLAGVGCSIGLAACVLVACVLLAHSEGHTLRRPRGR